MWLVVALGNAGETYQFTRHNAGWVVVDEILGEEKLIWEHSKYAEAEYLESQQLGQEVLWVKPQTMMNLSGRSVRYFIEKQGFGPGNIILIHDDTDIALGNIQIAKGKGSAQHNGVESITQALGTNDYVRIRLGIGRSEFLPRARYVLEPFSQEELVQIKQVARDRVAPAIRLIMQNQLAAAMNQFN